MLEKPEAEICITYDVALIKVYNLPYSIDLVSRIFNALTERDINIDLISQSPPYKQKVNLSFSILNDELIRTILVINSFRKIAPDILLEINTDNTKINIRGDIMRNLPYIAAKLFIVFAESGVEIKLATTSETVISCLIYEMDVDKAIKAISGQFNIMKQYCR